MLRCTPPGPDHTGEASALRRFPVHADKSPDTGGVSWQDDQWSQWTPPENAPYGVAVPEGYLVIDVDVPSEAPVSPVAGRSAPHRYRSVGGRGTHEWWRYNGPSCNGHRPWGDLKGSGGYVVVPSPDCDPWPAITTAPEMPPLPRPLRAGQGRNNALTSIAGSLTRSGVDLDHLDFANACLAEPLEARELSRIKRSAERWEPPPVPDAPVSLAGLVRNPPPPEPWVVDDLIPPGLTVLFGPPKVGKSWAALELCLGVGSGESWLGHHCEQAPALLVSTEDTATSLVERMRQLDREGTGVDVAWGGDPASYVDGRWRLVVVDILATSVDLGEAAIDGGYWSWYERLSPLRSDALAAGVALVVVHHAGKSGSLLGSTAILGAADCLIGIEPPNHEHALPKVTWHGKRVLGGDTLCRLPGALGAVAPPAEHLEVVAGRQSTGSEWYDVIYGEIGG